MNYENQICTGCGQPMREGEDIVVCPDCATPQHRACYNKLNGCVNGYLHASGYVWQPDNSTAQADNNRENNFSADNGSFEKENLCPVCGAKNPPDAVQCERCRNPLANANPSQPPFGAFPPFGSGFGRPAINPYLAGLPIREDENIGGEKAGDIAFYVRRNARKFLPKFQAFSQNESRFFSWNWAAFFLTPFYFFYRRMAKAGFLFMGILLALSLCLTPLYEKHFTDYQKKMNAYIEAFYNESVEAESTADTTAAPATQPQAPAGTTAAPAAQSVSAAAKPAANTPGAAGGTSPVTQQQLNQMAAEAAEAFTENARAFLRNPAVLAILLGLLLCRIFAALTADKTYYKKVLRELSVLHQRCEDDNAFRAVLFRVGGTSVISFICSIFSYNFAFDLLISLADRLSR